MKKKILIIGSSGSLGRYIYNNLDRKKYSIFGIEKKNNLKKNIFTFKNIINKNISFDTVILAAGINPTKFSKKSSSQIYIENKKINNNCLRLINKKKINKIIFLSSFSVYKKKKFINENSKLEHRNLYAKSKIEFEKKLLELNNSIYILRLCSVIGSDVKNNWLTKIYNSVQNNKKVTLYNKNNNFNNCFDVEDLILVIKKILKKKSKTKKIYNCSSNGFIKMSYIKKILNKNPIFKNKVIFKFKNNFKEFYNDSSKIQKELKIKFKNSKEIIKRYFSFKIKKKIFIIGSKGYIGSYLCTVLKKNYEIHEINTLNDIRFKQINNNSTIVFCALKSNIKNFFKYNISILKDYINILKDKNFSKFIYFSTLHSNNLSYRNMHITRETLLKKYLKDKYIILGPGKVYGKKIVNSNYGINSMMYDYRKNKTLKIFGNGNNYCPHIHISDLAEFFEKILELKDKTVLNKKFQIFDQEKKTFYQLANIFKKYDKNVLIFKNGKELKYKYNSVLKKDQIKFKCKVGIENYIKNFINKNVT